MRHKVTEDKKDITKDTWIPMQWSGVIVIEPQTEQAQKQDPKNLTFLAYKHGHRLTEKYL